MAFAAHEAPVDSARVEAGQKLEGYFEKIDARKPGDPDEEAEEGIEGSAQERSAGLSRAEVKIVFDTNILARAHQRATGPARRALLLAATGPHILITSSHILLELERIFTYPRLLRSSGLSAAEIAEYLERLSAISQLVEPVAVPPNLIRDLADEAVLGTALAVRAEFLCTLDAHLQDHDVRMFAHLSGTEILTDRELLAHF